MRDVYVIGIGITSFTRLEYPLSEIAAYPAMMALKDAGLREVDHLYAANMGGGRVNHQTGLASAVVDTLSLTPAGAETIENGPASGASAIKEGFLAVASGMHDTVLVTGANRGIGLALCRLCHWTFDEGLIGVSQSYLLQTSPRLRATHNLPAHLATLEGRGLLTPQDPDYNPARDSLAWHLENVFRVR